jgi:multiple sugar transport system permease protein
VAERSHSGKTYALARFRFLRPRNGSLLTWFLSRRVLPPVVVVIPFFLVMVQLRMLDSIVALIIWLSAQKISVS